MKSKVTINKRLDFNGSQPPTKEISSIIESCQKILVVSHLDPDGDALGTMLAFWNYLKSIGKEAYMMRDGEIPDKYNFLSNLDEIHDAEECKNQPDLDLAIILECPNVNRIGRGHTCVTEKVRIINIDHHRDNNYFGEVNWINAEASSVGEMVYEYFSDIGYKPDKKSAEQLYVALMTDTGRFRYRSTSKRTMQIAGELIATGIDTQKICDAIYYNMKPSTLKLTGKVLNNIEFYHNEQVCVLTLTNKLLEESEAERTEADGFVDFTLFGNSVIIGAFIKEIDSDKCKVSLRSKDSINVAELASRYGGGGHLNAAGFVLDMNIEDGKKEVVKLLDEALGEH